MKKVFLGFCLITFSLLSWAFSSPIASTIDEDHWHLPSIWCARGEVDGSCELGEKDGQAIVSVVVGAAADCYQYKPQQSGACTYKIIENPQVKTKIGVNYESGSYPNTFYRVMNVFVGNDAVASMLKMRLFNILIFFTLATLVYWISSDQSKRALIWSLLIMPIPFTYSIMGSSNPSTWSITGLALAPALILGIYNFKQLDIYRKIILIILIYIDLNLILGSRNDVSVYLSFIIPAVILSIIPIKILIKKYLYRTLGIFIFSLIILYQELATIRSFAINGLGNSNALGKLPDSIQENYLVNFFEFPKTFLGTFGYFWGLGWNDLRMPQSVWLTGFTVFILFLSVSLKFAPISRILGTFFILFLTILFPVTVAIRGNFRVEGWLQPRYILPLIPVLIYIASYRRLNEQKLVIDKNTFYTLLILSIIVFTFSLHLYLRRYLTGIDYWNWNLNSKVEWWWVSWPSPMLIWIIACLTFGYGYFLLGKNLIKK